MLQPSFRTIPPNLHTDNIPTSCPISQLPHTVNNCRPCPPRVAPAAEVRLWVKLADSVHHTIAGRPRLAWHPSRASLPRGSLHTQANHPFRHSGIVQKIWDVCPCLWMYNQTHMQRQHTGDACRLGALRNAAHRRREPPGSYRNVLMGLIAVARCGKPGEQREMKRWWGEERREGKRVETYRCARHAIGAWGALGSDNSQAARSLRSGGARHASWSGRALGKKTRKNHRNQAACEVMRGCYELPHEDN